MTDWAEIFAKLGLPTGMLLIVVLALWKTGRWSAANVVTPVVNGHLEWLKKSELRDERQTELLAKLVDESSRVREMASAHMAACDLVRQARDVTL